MLGERLKNYIEQNGIKQTFLADKTGMSPQTINAILNNGRKIEATEYYNICNALNLSLEFLFQSDKEAG